MDTNYDDDELPDIDEGDCGVIMIGAQHKDNYNITSVNKRNEFYSDSSDVEDIGPVSLSERLRCATTSNDYLSTNFAETSDDIVTFLKKSSYKAASSDSINACEQRDELSEADLRRVEVCSALGRFSQDTAESYADTDSTGLETEENSEEINVDGSSLKKNKLIKSNSRSDIKAAKDRIKEEKRLEREKMKAEREKMRKEADFEKTRKRMLQEAGRTMKPGECLKHMTVVLDTSLLTQSCGTAIATFLQGVSVRYEVCEQSIPNSITFWRASTVVVESTTRNLENVQKDVVENDVVIFIPLPEFLDMISAYQKERDMVSGVGASVNNEATLTLDTYLRSIKSSLPSNHRLTLIVSDIERHFRSQNGADKGKAKAGNKRAGAVGSASSRTHVTRPVVDECLLMVQLEHQAAVEFVESDAEIAKLIFYYVKAIAEAPYKRSRQQTGFDLFMNGSRSVKVGKEGEGLLQVWREQLMQFKNVNVEMANAIVAKYPSPRLLKLAYEDCASEKEAELLLQDIEVRRGAGVLSTVRRIGKELSRRVHELMTGSDPSYVIK